jgi:hypothetical protein
MHLDFDYGMAQNWTGYPSLPALSTDLNGNMLAWPMGDFS